MARTRSIGHTLAGMALACSLLSPARAELPDPLTLEHALSLADQPHPVLQQASALVDSARAEQARVDALDNARVDLELAARFIEPSFRAKPVEPSNNDSWAKLRIHKRLYDFGRTDLLAEAADAQLREGELSFLSARQQRRLVVMRNFFDVLLADLEQSRDTEAMAIAFVRLDRARNRSELGQTSDVELLELESRYQRLLRLQRTSQAKQRASRSRLALALNHPQRLPANLETPDLPALNRKAEEVDALLLQALSNNPQLRSLRAAVDAARKRTDASLAGNGSVIRGEIQGVAYNRSMGGSDPFVAALVLEVPLSTGGALEAEADRNRALARRKRGQLAARELEIRQSVLDLWLDLQTLDARRRELEALAEFRDLDFDRSRALYELEFNSDLGDAMTRISELRLLQAQNDFNIVLTWARLDALGGRLIGAAGAAGLPAGNMSNTE